MTSLPFDAEVPPRVGEWLVANPVPEDGQAVIRWAFMNPEARNVRSTGVATSGYTPNWSIGRLASFEGRIELALQYKLWQRGVIAFTSQPDLARGTPPSSEAAAIAWTDDVLSLEATAILYEAKSSRALRTVIEHGSTMWAGSVETGFSSPKRSKVLGELGLRHMVITELDLDPTEFGNLSYMRQYQGAPDVPAERAFRIVDAVRRAPGITIYALIRAGFQRSDVDILIFRGIIYFPYSKYTLDRPEHARVWASEAVANLLAADHPSSFAIGGRRPLTIDLAAGSVIEIEGRRAEVRAIVDGRILVRREGDTTLQPIGRAEFERLANEGAVRAVAAAKMDPYQTEAARKVATASSKRLAKAYRYADELAHWAATGLVPAGTSLSSLKRHKRRQKRLMPTGNGLAGLLPDSPPGRPRGFEPRIEALIVTVADDLYWSNKHSTLVLAAAEIQQRCDDQGLYRPNERTIQDRIKELETPERRVRRFGFRGAYADAPYVARDFALPNPNGAFAFDCCHIDATRLDLEALYGKPCKGMRPWLYRAVDGYLGLRIAMHLSFEPPSSGKVRRLLREQIRSWGRLHKRYVVDLGPENQNDDFKDTAAGYEIEILSRPAARARYGLPVERPYLTINMEVLRSLPGETSLMRNPRAVSDSHNPKRLAMLVLSDVYQVLDDWDNLHARSPRPDGLVPIDLLADSLEMHGDRPWTFIPYTPMVRVLLAESVDGRERVIDGTAGVEAHYLFYWHPLCSSPFVKGRTAPVNRESEDITRVLLYVPGPIPTDVAIRAEDEARDSWGIDPLFPVRDLTDESGALPDRLAGLWVWALCRELAGTRAISRREVETLSTTDARLRTLRRSNRPGYMRELAKMVRAGRETAESRMARDQAEAEREIAVLRAGAPGVSAALSAPDLPTAAAVVPRLDRASDPYPEAWA